MDGPVDADRSDGSRWVRLEAGTLAVDGVEELEIVVADSGPGLGPDAAAHAFERGWTTKPTDRPLGRGIGLALVAQAVHRLGGSIDVANEVGAVFSRAAAAAVGLAAGGAGARGRAGRPPRVSPSTSPADPSRRVRPVRRGRPGWSERGVRCVGCTQRRVRSIGAPARHPVCRPTHREDPAVRIAMVQGRADPEKDGVADYVRHLSAALTAAGEEVVPVPVLGPREAATRLRAVEPGPRARRSSRPRRSASRRARPAPEHRARPAVRHHAARVRLVGLAAVGAGRAVAPGGTRRLVGPRDRRFAPRSSALLTTNAGTRGSPADGSAGRPSRCRSPRTSPDLGAGDRAEARARLGVPPTPRSSRSSGSCTRSRACATSSRPSPGCAAPAGTGCTCSSSAASPRSRCPRTRPAPSARS